MGNVQAYNRLVNSLAHTQKLLVQIVNDPTNPNVASWCVGQFNLNKASMELAERERKEK